MKKTKTKHLFFYIYVIRNVIGAPILHTVCLKIVTVDCGSSKPHQRVRYIAQKGNFFIACTQREVTRTRKPTRTDLGLAFLVAECNPGRSGSWKLITVP
jgi:hypothetical protein